MRVYSPALLTKLRAWADTHGVYLIADEIAAGMGRLGHALASHHAPDPALASPDFAVVAKGLTAGTAPMACVLTTDALYDLFDSDYRDGKQFMHSNTFAGYALAVAAAHATFDVFADHDVLADVQRRGPSLVDRFTQLAADRPVITNVRGCGFVAAIDLQRPDGPALDPHDRTGYAVYRAAVQRGALFRNLGDTMYLFPPLISTDAELDAMTGILADAIDAVLG